MPPLIRNREARRLLLDLQGLSRPPRRSLDAAGLQALVHRLGFVQLDSINTVERAHHQILFSRAQTYRPAQLRHLHEDHRSLFENWTHDASLVPTELFPYWRHRFARERVRLRERWRKWQSAEFESMISGVLRHVRDNGPTLARDLGNDGPRKKTAAGWWDWHPTKTALEYLWRTGELAVARREGFQKVYDLTERIIPAPYVDAAVPPAAYIDWACSSAMERLGFATPGDIAAFWEGVSIEDVKTWCAAQLGHRLLEVDVEGADGDLRRCLARCDVVQSCESAAVPPSRLRVLSPFDPLIRDRARTEHLFGFRYRIEVFVPQARREYGYYVFPLLEGDRLVGRIDMKHHRKDGDLRVAGLWWEPGVRTSSGRQARLLAELERVRAFTGAQRVSFALAPG